MGNFTPMASVPGIMRFFNFKENKGVDPNLVSSNSTNTINWRCKDCGYTWASSVKARRGSQKCPCCESHKAIQPGYNDAFTVLPELKLDYDFDKNKHIDLTHLGISDETLLSWKCHVCGREWEASLFKMARKKDGVYVMRKCPHKDKKYPIKPVSECPDLLTFWDYEKNDDIKNYKSNAEAIVFWHCKKCGHSWDSSIKDRTRSSGKCPQCELGMYKIVEGVNDIFTKIPELRKFYDFEKNKDVDTLSLKISSKDRLWWKCENGHSWQGTISGRINRIPGGGYSLKKCQQCYLSDPSRITPMTTVPKMLKFWDYERNSVSPENVSINSLEKYYWCCKNCGYEWEASPKARKLVPDKCPCCDSRTAVSNDYNSLLAVYPELGKYIDFDKNKEVGIDIYSLSSTSKKKIYYHCPSCGKLRYVLAQKICSRREDGSIHITKCKECRRVRYDVKYPELNDLYSIGKNDKPLSELTGNDADTFFWWNCSVCGKEFESRLGSMVQSLSRPTKGCPRCSHRIIDEKISFASCNQDIMDEYSPNNDIDPYTIAPSSPIEVEWVCRNDSSHKWNASFTNRNSGYGKCPVCYPSYPIKGVNTIEDVCPDKAKRWDYDKNTFKPDELLPTSFQWTYWICEDCNQSFGCSANDYIEGKAECPYCKRKENSFIKAYPDVVNQLDDVSNALLSYDITLLTNKSNRGVWWHCDKGHTYFMSPHQKLYFDMRHRDSCPYCKGRRKRRRYII